MNDNVNRIPPITTGRPTTGGPKTPTIKGGEVQGPSFSEMLRGSLSKATLSTQSPALTFSKHAQIRAAQRGVELSTQDMQKLEGALEIAASKGITDSLVYLHDTAYIVNVPSKVVVTVMDSADQSVFTNIDGAVIL